MSFHAALQRTLFTAALAALAQPAFAGDPANFSLPTTHQTLGDANVYSLQLGCAIAGLANSSCPHYVSSTPGAIKDLVVIGTGSNGTGVTTNFVGMDDAFGMPSGRSPPPFFRTGGTTVDGVVYPGEDPGGANQFTGDQSNTWDASLTSLRTFLGGQAPVFFFNNNQVNSGASTNQYLASWGQAYVTDATNKIVGIFDLTANGGLYKSTMEGGAGVIDGNVANYTSAGLSDPTRGPGLSTDYIFTGGPACLNASNVLVPCDGSDVAKVINNNLGADQAAFAVVLPELNDLLNTLFSLGNVEDYAFHLDLRFGCDPTLFSGDECIAKSLNNGYEQIFMGRLANEETHTVPEPSSLALMGALLMGLGWNARRNKKA